MCHIHTYDDMVTVTFDFRLILKQLHPQFMHCTGFDVPIDNAQNAISKIKNKSYT